MLARVNVLGILKDHFLTLRRVNQKTSFIYWADLLLFFIIPIIISVLLTIKGYTVEKQIEELIASISIFGGFLLNLLGIIYSQIDKIEQDASDENNYLKKKFVNEIHANISFCILLSIATDIILLLTTVEIPKFEYTWLVKKAIIGIGYFLLILFLLSLIMVLNRVYILLKKDTEKQKPISK